MSERNFLMEAQRLLADEDIGSLFDVFRNAPELLDEIRERAKHSDSEAARQTFQEMSEIEQTRMVDSVVSDIAISFAQLRQEPAEGVEQLATHIREPYTMEALLLVFDNEEHIDGEYSEDIKEFVRWRVRWVGAELLPEVYTDDELEEIADRFDLTQERSEAERTNS